MKFFNQYIYIVFLVLIISTSCGHKSGRKKNSTNRSNKIDNTINQRNKESLKSEKATYTFVPKKANDRIIPINELYNLYKESVFLIYTTDGNKQYQGSGFFISDNGLAISNYHVFEGTSEGLEVIKTIDGNQYKIEKVLEKNKEFDYIIFKVDLGEDYILNPISVNQNGVQIGEDVIAIGNPKGLESTLSKGIISSLRDNKNIIQTTAEITNGSSGGPLLNMKGNVIGITTAGFGEANLNFAINISVLNLDRFLNYQANDNSNSYDFYPIKKFVDGDTFWVDDGTSKGKKIRLIGVDTPETRHPTKGVEYYGKEASKYVKNLLTNKRVRLEFDVEKKDRYGRLLAYVYLEDGTFLNANLVENGYAQVSTYPPNVKYVDLFLSLQKKARAQNKGLWKR